MQLTSEAITVPRITTTIVKRPSIRSSYTMPTTLQKVRKQIAKKKGGQLGAMHDGSRNMRRLRAAGGRDDKLDRLAASKKRQNQPLRM
jgi:hypothetical protein